MPFTLVPSSMALLHCIGQDNSNEVQHAFFGHMMPLSLELVSHDANSTINDTIAFLRSSWLKWGTSQLFGPCDATGTMSYDASSIINGSIAFLRSSWLIWSATWLIGHEDTTDTGTGVRWWQWHHQWHHCILYVKTFVMWCNMTFLAMWVHWCWSHIKPMASSIAPSHSLGHGNKNDVQQDVLVMWHHQNCSQHHITSAASLIAQLYSLG